MRLLSVLFSTVLGLAQPVKPRLVVVVTLDQCRADYLERYHDQFLGGLRRLLHEGAVYSEAFQDHALTETAPGHATILSGRWPAHTGILRNAAGVQDSTAPLLGVRGPGASPRRFRGTSFFDWLQAQEPAARALSVSRKDRAAILVLGRAKQQVYWYDAGWFTTSRYYADSLPGWVRDFNALRLPFREAGAAWPLLLVPSEYPEPDSEPYEHGGRDFTFPHSLPSDSTAAAAALVDIPTMDSLTLAFALEGARALGLGGRGTTDLLAIGLSTTDAIGHLYGPESREIHDQLLRLDRYLGWFLGQLFVRFGEPGVMVVLTADHGVTPFPAWSRAHGHPDARAVSIDSIVGAANTALGARAGAGDWLSVDTGILLLPDTGPLARAGVNVDSVVTALAARIRAVPGVARVDRPADLTRADTTDRVVRRWRHAVPPDAGVALVITLTPYSVWGDGVEAEHGQPSDLDTHVPLIFWGRAFRRGTYRERVAVTDLAPTLAAALGLTPGPVDGHVLNDALETR
jgi:hypothetical protein